MKWLRALGFIILTVALFAFMIAEPMDAHLWWAGVVVVGGVVATVADGVIVRRRDRG